MSHAHRPRQPGASLAHIALPHVDAFQPIPAQFADGHANPAPWDLAAILPAAEVTEITQAGNMTFHCVGDTGGVKNPDPQAAVAAAMEAALASPQPNGASLAPSFFYHLGDVIYFNGETDQYYAQFYDPYSRYPLPILGIPGNHDGAPLNARSVSLEGFHRNFVATPNQDGSPVYSPESQDSGRAAMAQPFFYHALTTPFATIIGLYSNVPEHGEFDATQRAWLHAQMQAADPARALIIAVHHPIYSFDDFHSGSPTMAQELQDAINATGRIPNMVLTAHVHNYQRIEKQIAPGITIPFFVIGGGGYHNMHKLAAAPGYTDPETGAALIAAIEQFGFMTFNLSPGIINGRYHAVAATATETDDPTFDVFSYSARPLFLPQGTTATLLPTDGANIQPVMAPASEAARRKQAAIRAHAARTSARISGH